MHQNHRTTTRPSLHRSILAGAAGVALLAMAGAPPLPAQMPSAWSSLSPPGGVNAAALQSGRTVAVYRDGLYLRAYSAVTRRWYAHQPSFGTSVHLRDELIAVPESDRWTVFSPYRGAFAELLVDTNNSTWQAASAVFVVRHGATAHAFSSFTGTWSSHAVPSGWTMALHDRIVAFADTTVAGPSAGALLFDAFAGQWHEVAGSSEALRLRVGGGSALLQWQTSSVGFSASRGALEVLPAAVQQLGGTLARNNLTDLVDRGGVVWSGLSGTMLQPPYAPPPFPGNNASYQVNGLVIRAARAFEPLYVAGTSGWHVLPPAAVPTGEGVSWMSFGDGTEVHAFSAVTDQVVSHTFLGPIVVSSSGDHVTALADAVEQRLWLFSGLTGQWYEAPAAALPATPVTPNFVLGDTGAILRTANGALGFSAHDGQFVAMTGSALVFTGGHSTALAASNDSELHVFDAAKATWSSAPRGSGALPPVVSQVGWPSSVLLAEDATQVIGHGARGGSLEALPLTAAVLGRGVMGDLAWVRTAATLHMFSGCDEQLSWTGLPHDLAGIGRGGKLRHQLLLDDGEVALLGLAPRLSAPFTLAPFGEVWLDLQVANLLLLAPAAGEQRALLTVPLPDVPALRGSEWFLQPLRLSPALGAYLSAPTSFRVF